MEKNRLYTIIFVLLFILILLFGLLSLLSGNRRRSATDADILATPTGNVVVPTRVAASGNPTVTLAPDNSNAVLALAFPVRYDTIMVDYVPEKSQLIVFYGTTRAEGEQAFQNFLNLYQTNTTALKVSVEYIGLQKESDEPISGQPQ